MKNKHALLNFSYAKGNPNGPLNLYWVDYPDKVLRLSNKRIFQTWLIKKNCIENHVKSSFKCKGWNLLSGESRLSSIFISLLLAMEDGGSDQWSRNDTLNSKVVYWQCWGYLRPERRLDLLFHIHWAIHLDFHSSWNPGSILWYQPNLATNFYLVQREKNAECAKVSAKAVSLCLSSHCCVQRFPFS